jgi:hypothetical protein
MVWLYNYLLVSERQGRRKPLFDIELELLQDIALIMP